jgi:hypothetical protein
MKYQRQKEEGEKPSGCYSMLTRCRKFFCCSNGFYPLLVAPLVTAAWLLDVYGSLGCSFINLDIGVDPINIGWNRTSVLDFGLFYYSDSEGTNVDAPFYMETFHPECRKFEDIFSEYFIDGDKTWKVSMHISVHLSISSKEEKCQHQSISINIIIIIKLSQVMAIVSGCAGTLATLIIWLFVFFPIPICAMWSGVLLPSVLALFLAGGSKFLLFDTEICGSALWIPFGDVSSPVEAKSCSLANDSFTGIFSTILALLCMLLICMKSPKNTRDNNDYKHGNQSGEFADTDGLRTNSSIHSDEYDNEAQVDSILENRVGIRKGKSYDMDYISSDMPLDGADRNVVIPSEAKSQKIRMYNQSNKAEMMRRAEDSVEIIQTDEYDQDDDRIQPKYSTGIYSRWTPSPRTQEVEKAFSFRSPLKVFQKQKILSPEPCPYDENKIHKCLAELEQSFSG